MANLSQSLQSIFNYLNEAFFPPFCINCQSGDKEVNNCLCNDCRAEIKLIKTATCPECGRITNYGQYCPDCRDKTALTGMVIATKFDGPVKEMIHFLKYNKYQSLAQSLGSLISKRLSLLPVRGDLVLIAVPLHFWRFASRGFNQSELIARVISKNQHISLIRGLTRVKNTPQQMKLKRAKRLENLNGAFKIRDPKYILGKTVLLVDDVCTTGSTLNECAKVLRHAGAKHVWGVVVAKG